MTLSQSQGKTPQVRNAEFNLAKDQIVRDFEMQLRMGMVKLLTMHAATIATQYEDLPIDDHDTNLREDVIIGGDKFRVWMGDISTVGWIVSVNVFFDFEPEGDYTATLVFDRKLGLRFEGDFNKVEYPTDSSDPEGDYED